MTTSSIYTRKVRGTGETLTIGLATELGIDAELKYVTVCEDHNNIVEAANRELAYKTTGIDFCDDCRAAQAVTTPSREDEIAKARTVDTEVARLWGEFHKVNDKIAPLAKRKGQLREYAGYWAVERITAEQDKLAEQIAKLNEQAEPLRVAAVSYDEAHYEGWNRFFLVKHIHSSQRCSSFRWNTKIGWLPDVSGLTEAEAVAAHGETLCTICFPSAPVALTTKAVDPNTCPGTTYSERRGMGGICADCGKWVAFKSWSNGSPRKHKKESK